MKHFTPLSIPALPAPPQTTLAAVWTARDLRDIHAAVAALMRLPPDVLGQDRTDEVVRALLDKAAELESAL